MNLSPQAHSIIVGTLLGDAYLYPNGTLQIEHRLDHVEYVVWKYEMLRGVAGKPPSMVERRDSRTSKVYRSMRFYTRAVLGHFRESFYQDKKKIVPINIGELLDSLAVAVWFMDDGGRGARTPRGLVFNTSCFALEEQFRLRKALAERFGVEASIHKCGMGFQLYIRSRSFKRFSELISPHLVARMRYKLPVDPVTTSPLRRRNGGCVREGETIYGLHNTSALT